MRALVLAGALIVAALPAAAQTSGSTSGSISLSESGVNYSPTSIVKDNRVPGAASVIGNAASSPYKCRDVGGLSTPYFGLAMPIPDEDCGPIVAAMAWDACKSEICRSTLTQNRYIAQTVRTIQQHQAAAVAARPAPQAAFSSARSEQSPAYNRPTVNPYDPRYR